LRSAFGQELPTGGDHRFGSLVDGLDDLGVVDSAEVSGCDREVGVTELPRDHDQRDPLTRHLGEMRAPTAAMADAYMASLFAMLGRLPFVQRCAWFTDDCWNHPDCRFGSLFNARGRLTSPGRVFEAAR
jgi:hypothetical protein